MKFKFFIVLLPIVLFLLTNPSFIQKVNKGRDSEKVLSSENRIIKSGPFQILSFKTAPMVGKTQIFTSQSSDPLLSLDGFFYKARFIELDTHRKWKIFVLELNAGGKLMNSLIYKYQNDKLIEIPVETNSEVANIWSSGGTEFKDIDGDGIIEMFVYHRHYPPERSRTVEIYRFKDEVFQNQQMYEEATSEIYL